MPVCLLTHLRGLPGAAISTGNYSFQLPEVQTKQHSSVRPVAVDLLQFFRCFVFFYSRSVTGSRIRFQLASTFPLKVFVLFCLCWQKICRFLGLLFYTIGQKIGLIFLVSCFCFGICLFASPFFPFSQSYSL
uniref:(northern house mosquito) hypothetical protein n=1 Tax=Culex pipiens TaxID=7175 RepID=A0A8D8JR55_CULPI